METAQSKYYQYAAKDLAHCGLLGTKIDNWGNFQPHSVYNRELELTHKRKTSFWSQYQSALQSQASKANR